MVLMLPITYSKGAPFYNAITTLTCGHAPYRSQGTFSCGHKRTPDQSVLLGDERSCRVANRPFRARLDSFAGVRESPRSNLGQPSGCFVAILWESLCVRLNYTPVVLCLVQF